MKLSLRKLPLVVYLLIVCGSVCPAQPGNCYNQELEQLRASWGSAADLRRLVLLDRIFRLRDYVDDPAAISTMLAEMPGETPLLGSEAEAYLNDIDLLEGRIRSGTARHWWENKEQRAQVLAQAGKNLSDPANLDLLAGLEQIAGISDATGHMQQAAQLSPTARRWEQAAALAEDPLTKFSALQAALQLEPENVSARLQLSAYYIGRRQLEKAQGLLQEASRTAPGNFVVGEKLAGLYLNVGLRSAALHQLKELEARSTLPLWLQEHLALDYEQIGLLDDGARLASSVLRYKSTDREELHLLARFHERRHMPAELQSDYAALLKIDPNSVDAWSRLAQLQLQAGNLLGARESLDRMLHLDPKNGEAHQQLARIYAQLGRPQQQQEELAAYSASLQTGRPFAEASSDSGLLSDPQKLTGEVFRHPPKDDEIALADVRIEELYPTGLSRVHVQQIFYIGSEAGAAAHRVASIRYSPGSQAVRVLHARIHKPNGTVIEALEDGESPVAERAISMYYDARLRQLRFAGLEKGDVVELEYSLLPTTAENPYPGYFGELITLAGRTPARLRRYALIYPSAKPVFVHGERVPAPSHTEATGFHTIVWELHNVAATPREPRSPGVTELSPYVHVSTMADWSKLGAWYADLIRPQFVLDDPLRKELDRVLQGKRSDQEKITAIQEFVLRSTHYVALEFGIYSYKPYSVAQTYARRFGDCKDKASLMISLLRAAGIEAEIALLRTRSLGDVALTPASMALFDHAIVYVPKYSVWLDGTAEYAGKELPLEDQGAMALTVNLNGAAELRQVPMSAAADNYTRRSIRAQLTRLGIIHFDGSTVTRGDGAPVLRREMAVPEEQLGLFRQRLAEVFPTVQVESVAVHGADDLDSAVSVDFQGEVNALTGKSSVTLGSSWMPRNYTANFAPTGSRTQDLMLGMPWITEEEIHVSLPSGAIVQQLPADEDTKTSFGSVLLHYEKSAHEIVIQSRLEFDKTRIKAEEYPEFRQFCATVERSFRNQIVVDLENRL